MTELVELFSFLDSERADVRKMATAGVAQVSKDNKELFAFFTKDENKSSVQKFCDLVDPRLPAPVVQTLADVLLAIINLSVDNSCCDTLVQHTVPLKLIKVYETLQVKGDDVQNGPVLCELTLMALNNLTSTSTAACEQVLELADEDLAGYHFGRLKTHYDRAPDFFGDEHHNNNIDDVDGGDSSKEKNSSNTGKSASQRKWLLQIALNVSRTMAGTKIFMDDEEWRPIVPELIDHKVPYIRGIGMQLVRNLANYRDLSHSLLVDEMKCPAKILFQITHSESDLTMLHGWVDVLGSLITSEAGMRGMDEVNAKRALVPLVAIAKKKHETKVEELNEDGTEKVSEAGTRKSPLPWEVAKRIEEEILPYLDDIQDVYVNEQE